MANEADYVVELRNMLSWRARIQLAICELCLWVMRKVLGE